MHPFAILEVEYYHFLRRLGIFIHFSANSLVLTKPDHCKTIAVPSGTFSNEGAVWVSLKNNLKSQVKNLLCSPVNELTTFSKSKNPELMKNLDLRGGWRELKQSA